MSSQITHIHVVWQIASTHLRHSACPCLFVVIHIYCLATAVSQNNTGHYFTSLGHCAGMSLCLHLSLLLLSRHFPCTQDERKAKKYAEKHSSHTLDLRLSYFLSLALT